MKEQDRRRYLDLMGLRKDWSKGTTWMGLHKTFFGVAPLPFGTHEWNLHGNPNGTRGMAHIDERKNWAFDWSLMQRARRAKP